MELEEPIRKLPSLAPYSTISDDYSIYIKALVSSNLIPYLLLVEIIRMLVKNGVLLDRC